MKEYYKPPYTVTPIMIHRIAEIMELLGQIKAKKETSLWLPEMRGVFRLEAIHSSLAIENSPFSLEEVRSILQSPMPRIPNKAEVEVKNAQSLYQSFDQFRSTSQQDLKRSHQHLMNTLIEDSGRYRKKDVGIYQGSKVIFMAPGARQVPGLMDRLFDYLTTTNDHVLISSSVFHYEFEFIHPFSDGNGRMGRFWQKRILADQYSVFSFLAIEKTIYRYQQEYYKSISDSHNMGESTPFIEFMLRVIHETILDALGAVSLQTSIQVERMIEVMKIGLAYQPKELMSLLSLKSRSSFFNHYLKPALASGRVERAFPEQPRSRYQRYLRLW
jgi:Fic family protein